MADGAGPSGAPTALDVTRAISQVLWKVQELEATLASYDALHAEHLEQRLVQYEGLLSSTRDMLRRHSGSADEEQLGNTLAARKLPEDLIKALDEGVNPDEYLRETFKACRRDNQVSKGKAEALQLLFSNLLTDAGDVLPAEAAAYRRLLGL